ncbi:aquaporin-10 [Rhinatrema bivittatum]|uniref:aquaporin-10 n=1 Tax=Rhinatrema bivittatum TaxID=194408 RepID=UPI0011275778|nr:aquaporin-10 [Rhinatrema bivittatum]
MAKVPTLDQARPLLRIENATVRQCLAEFLGVFLLILITIGATAQSVTSFDRKGGYFPMCLAGALAVTMAIYVSGGVSGGHLNPAYSLSLCLLGRFQWTKLPLFFLVQTSAAFLAAAGAYALYYDAIHNYCSGNLTVTGPRETASIFATYPASYLSAWNGFLDQVIGTATLLLSILSLVDSKNKPVPKGLEPVVVGMVVLSIGLSMGSNCGYPINPARDLGPRLFTWLAGWGPEVFSAGNNWWWIPIVAPLVGAVIGSTLYELMIEFHHPETQSELTDAGKESHCLEAEKGRPPVEAIKAGEVPVFTIDTYMEGFMQREGHRKKVISHRL